MQDAVIMRCEYVCIHPFIYSCLLHLPKINSHWPILCIKSGLWPGALQCILRRSSHTRVLYASGFAAVSARRRPRTLTSACQRRLCIHTAPTPQWKGHNQVPLCKGLIFITKKVSFQFHSEAWQLRSVKVIIAFWMRLSMHSCISNQRLHDEMESLEFWFPIICQTLNKPLKCPNEWYLWMRNRKSLFPALIWGWGLSSCSGFLRKTPCGTKIALL